jgi:hypothetical protein
VKLPPLFPDAAPDVFLRGGHVRSNSLSGNGGCAICGVDFEVKEENPA